MQINADLSKRAVVDANALDWVPSPLPGVERRMLERDGEEVARATSIVRYAPGSAFSAHTHSGGEEFLVLDGTFSDEMGDFPKGMYVRNPVGSSHTPSSAQGCTIFVKLWQMPAEDQAFVRIDTGSPDGWLDGDPGERVRRLHASDHETVEIRRWSPGARIAERVFPGGAEYLVLEGGFDDAGGRYGAGTWLRLPPGGAHAPHTAQGCAVYVKTGHLAGETAAPGRLTAKHTA